MYALAKSLSKTGTQLGSRLAGICDYQQSVGVYAVFGIGDKTDDSLYKHSSLTGARRG